MSTRTLAIVVTLLLLLAFAGTAAASYAGLGLVWTGAPSARVGSIGGPAIQGGGPGSGK